MRKRKLTRKEKEAISRFEGKIIKGIDNIDDNCVVIVPDEISNLAYFTMPNRTGINTMIHSVFTGKEFKLLIGEQNEKN